MGSSELDPVFQHEFRIESAEPVAQLIQDQKGVVLEPQERDRAVEEIRALMHEVLAGAHLAIQQQEPLHWFADQYGQTSREWSQRKGTSDAGTIRNIVRTQKRTILTKDL